jgi:hypothetical protein
MVSFLLMWGQFRRFSALKRPTQGLFQRAMVLLPLVALSLRWRGLRATQASLKLLLSDSQLRTGAFVSWASLLDAGAT